MIDGVAAGTQTTPVSAPVRAGGTMGKDEFLKLFVTQVRNQDPASPMKGEEMAAQLAQFSSLEQLTNINATLAAQAEAQAAVFSILNGTAAMGMLGKTVLATGDQVALAGRGGETVPVNVGGQGGTATLHIYDESGREVGSRTVGPVAAGAQEIEVGSAAEGLPAGTYHYEMEVVDDKGVGVPVQTQVRARIDGVRYGETGPVLTAGGVTLRFGSIVEILSGE